MIRTYIFDPNFRLYKSGNWDRIIALTAEATWDAVHEIISIDGEDKLLEIFADPSTRIYNKERECHEKVLASFAMDREEGVSALTKIFTDQNKIALIFKYQSIGMSSWLFSSSSEFVFYKDSAESKVEAKTNEVALIVDRIFTALSENGFGDYRKDEPVPLIRRLKPSIFTDAKVKAFFAQPNTCYF